MVYIPENGYQVFYMIQHKITFEAKVGGPKGRSGTINLPKRFQEELGIKTPITLTFENNNIEAYIRAKFTINIPKAVVEKQGLRGRKFEFTLSKRVEDEWFSAKISPYKQVRLPKSIVVDKELSDRDIIELRIKLENGPELVEYGIIKVGPRKNRFTEHIVIIRTQEIQTKIKAKFKIQRIIEKPQWRQPSTEDDEIIYLPSLFQGDEEVDIGLIEIDKIIIFKGRFIPIITPLELKLGEIIHYMGAYFADGTKKGHAWRMSASTPEQGVYYLSRCQLMVFDEDYRHTVVYTKHVDETRSKREITGALTEYWKKRTNGVVILRSIRILDSGDIEGRNWNMFGSLQINNYKGLIMILHGNLLNHITDLMVRGIRKSLIWDFLFGGFEGDGFVSGGTERVGLGIATSVDHAQFFRKLFDFTNLKYSYDDHPVRKGISKGVKFSIFLIEILNHLDIIFPQIFLYYPKRRLKLFARILEKPLVKSIIQSPGFFYKSQNLPTFINRIVISRTELVRLCKRMAQELNH